MGDVVRGIQIGVESTQTSWGQVGTLNEVRIRQFNTLDVLGDSPPDIEGASEQTGKGLWIQLRHENAAYHAVFLPAGSAAENKSSQQPQWPMLRGQTSRGQELSSDAFIHLPLLLLRMPLPLQKVVGEWISSTFDSHVSKVTTGTRTIVGVWEGWLRSMGPLSQRSDISLSLMFNVPLSAASEETSENTNTEDTAKDPAGLRSIEITIAAGDIARFVRAGEAIDPVAQQARSITETHKLDPRERRRLAGGNAADGWAWRTETDSDTPEQPFTEALAVYLKQHLALDLFHPSVRISQVVCDDFVLASSRLKLNNRGVLTDELSRAAWSFVLELGQRVRGENVPTIF